MHAIVVELPTVESLSDEIRGVVYERQTLRAVGASREELERNRAELVRLQQALVQALIRGSAERPGSSSRGYSCLRCAVAVAQLVEPRVVVPVVGGSSPLRHPSRVRRAR